MIPAIIESEISKKLIEGPKSASKLFRDSSIKTGCLQRYLTHLAEMWTSYIIRKQVILKTWFPIITTCHKFNNLPKFLSQEITKRFLVFHELYNSLRGVFNFIKK